MKARIDQVYSEISGSLISTPLVNSPALDTFSGGKIYLKLENEQHAGSFKLRGVLSKFSELKKSNLDLSNVVAASTGNHALALCHAAKAFHSTPIIFVPKSVSKVKLKKLEELGVEIHQKGTQSGETEQLAIAWARHKGFPMIHPYNDSAVIVGQGTVGLELTRQMNRIDQVFVPVGGGGLISGIASYLKEVNPGTRIFGVQPENASEMTDSINEGRIVEPSKLTTISDGTAGGLDPDTITVQYCKQLVDGFILVKEHEITDAMRLLKRYLNLMVEPAAALALAGILKIKGSKSGKNCVAVVCGGNIDSQRFLELTDT